MEPGARMMCAIACLAMLASSPGLAGSGPRVTRSDGEALISEIRVGVLRHEPRQEGGADINLEVLLQRPGWQFDNAVLQFLLTPRPQIGGDINTQGDTSQAYAGLAWDAYLFGPLFIEGSFGGAIHDGETGRTFRDRALGCRVLFHESASIGVDVTDQVRLLATIDHSSNASLCNNNAGVTNYGVRVGYTF